MGNLAEALKQKYQTPDQLLSQLGLDARNFDDVVDSHSVADAIADKNSADAVVGDSKESTNMATKKVALTRKAALTMGALLGFLKPRLAVDAKIDWDALLSGITAKNYRTKKPALLANIKSQVSGKLAQDANIEGLAQLLDALEAEAPAEKGELGVPEVNPESGKTELAPPPDPALGGGAPAPAPGAAAPAPAPAPGLKAAGGGEEDVDDQQNNEEQGDVDQGMNDQLAAFLKSKGMQDADIAQACQLVAGGGSGGKGGGGEEEAGMDDITGMGGEKDSEKFAAQDDDGNSGSLSDHDVNKSVSGDSEESEGSSLGSTHDVNKKVSGTGAADEPPPFKGMPKLGGNMSNDSKRSAQDGDAVKRAALQAVKQAQDAANSAVKAAVEAERQRQKDIREAENVVRPWVGALTTAFDSASDIYRTALTSLGIKVDGVHPSALRTILELQPLPGNRSRRSPTADYAMDSVNSSNAAEFAKRNPGASRIDIL